METESKPAPPLVEAVGVSVSASRSNSVIASGVEWSIAPGEFWVVGGRHGSGKTSFLSTIAGLRHPASGTLRHFGEELAKMMESELLRHRMRIGYVFKGGGRMFAGLTVAENIALPLQYHRKWTEEKIAERVAEVLEATELARETDSTAQTLGWGRQQRVGLARALALNPEILFLDEPLSGLEARDRQWWRTFLDGLCQGSPLTERRPMTIIVTTNDFGFWIGGAHHCGLLQDGRWQSRGEVKDWPDIT
jgi:ABC-type transporter Mla maintaining outer membrane lipid asymmetry ATPase subunit MlaF